MAFETIPAELKLSIVELLDPFSAFDFALTCQNHWILCDSIIKSHKRLSLENHTIDAAKAGRLVWTKLKEILEDPRKGWYVRELSLPANRQTYWDPTKHGDFEIANETLPDEDMALFSAAAQKLERLYPVKLRDLFPMQEGDYYDKELVEHIEDYLRDIGADNAIITILVHHLPMLKVFRVTDRNIGGDVFERLLEQVAIGYGDPARAHLMPFQRLEAVGVAHYDTEGCCDSEWARHFSCIPSVKRFAAQAIGGVLSPDVFYSGDKLPTNSDLKELFFWGSQLHVSALQEILKNIRALEKFSYDGGGGIVSEDSYAPRRVIKLLSKYQGHSLKVLILNCDRGCELEEEDLNKVSLRKFQKLKKLRCGWETIYPGPSKLSGYSAYPFSSDEEDELLPEPDFHIKNILPDSLESLHLYGSFSAEERSMVDQQLGELSTIFPSLKDIHVETEEERGYVDMWDNPLMNLLEGHGC